MADLVERTSIGMVGVQLHEYEEVHTVPVRVVAGLVSDFRNIFSSKVNISLEIPS